MNRRSRQSGKTPENVIAPMEPSQAYHDGMLIVRKRLQAISAIGIDDRLVRAEQIALQVRKIIEGVAYASLSAVEVRNKQTLREQRSKDADKLLFWLNAKNLLKLPSAQRIETPSSAGIKLQLSGNNGAFDWTIEQLTNAFSRASALLHERHPERLSNDKITLELNALEEDAKRLREWLWLHIMFFQGRGFLVQMGQVGTSSFMVDLAKEN